MDPISSTATAPSPELRRIRALAVGSVVGLIVLGLAWELWLAPLPHRLWSIKVLPLLIPLAGLARFRMYTYRWVSLLVWLYFTEGVMRLWNDPVAPPWLPALQIALCLTLFTACALHVRMRLGPRKKSSEMNELIERLRAAVGAPHVLTEGDLSAWEQDWRKRVRGKALAVVRPSSTAEVAAVVRACAEAGVSIVPQGGNTGLVVGGVPDESGRQVVLSLQRMTGVRSIDRENLTMTVEAGAILQSVQEAADAAGLLFPLSLAAEGSCTIGGNLATNAGGTQVLRYGNARELCLGLEVVTAQGEVWDGLAGLRKDNTGYDLRQLFIGSEGTLGVITAATLKLYPRPAASLTAWAAVPTMAQAVQLLELAHERLGPGLTGFEVMGQFALSLVAKHYPQQRVPFVQESPWCVLIENSDLESEAHARVQFEGLLEAAMVAGVVTDAVVAENLSQAHQLWHVRESIPMAQAEEGLNIKHDVSVPISRIPAFCEETDSLLRKAIPGVRLVNFGHLGDGNLHYNVQAPEHGDAAAFLRDEEDRVNSIVHDQVHKFAGSISAEHGVGSLKVDKLPQYKSPVALGMMRAIKGALDPRGILNPGRVLRG